MAAKKAIALTSSGLDSMLAAKVVQDLGIEVTGLHCAFHFDAAAETDRQPGMDALFRPLEIPIVVRDITEPFLEVVLHPDHGYGSHVNPCIDCKIFMFKQAQKMMEDTGASFLVTGEVLGQRPMTQNKPMLYHIEKEAGMKGMVLRPLSAKKLRESVPELEGWVDREKLYGIAGRGRKDQIALAASLGINVYNQPAGGCLLTDPQFSARSHALFRHREKNLIQTADMQLLRLGRHFWPEASLHVIVGRNESENSVLEGYQAGRTLIEPRDISGPVTLAEGCDRHQQTETAAAITARYCKHENKPVRMRCIKENREFELEVAAFTEDHIAPWRI